jgi:DNA-binding MarR family transcriptional regulator
MTIGELARHVERAQSVVSESVAVLESHDLLARVRDPRDNRRTLVWLTELARTWLAEEQQPLERERLDAAFSAMEPTECERFIEAFERFINVAEQTRRASAETSSLQRTSSTDEVATLKTKGKKGKKP